MSERINVKICDIESKMTAIFRGTGMTEEDAKVITDALIDAEASGVESHGIIRLKAYVDRIAQGSISVVPDIRIKGDGVALQVDGGNGLGQIVMSKAVEKCIKTAKEYGVAALTVSRSNHFGTAAYYANKMAASGCIGFVATNAGSTMAPFGGMETLLGTNPFAVAFPASNQIFCADMATSSVAKGKIRIYEKEGREIPLGWALNVNGEDTQNAEEAIKGILLPMAGYKGYALAMAVDAVCGLLSGANLSCEAPSMFQTDQLSNVGHFIVAIDIAHFIPLEEFEKRGQTWFERLKSCKTRSGMRVKIPGEPENERRAAACGSLNLLAETAAMVDEYSNKILEKKMGIG